MAEKKQLADKELEQYRSLLDTPTEFKDGFGWTTVIGIFFCGLVMMPGAIYLGLMTGGNMGTAASWVTVILFMEIARRALKPLSKQNLVILLHAAHIMMVGSLLFPGGPMAHLVFRAYLVGSEAVRDAGMLGAFPTWFAPPYDSPAITERTFFHKDWLAPIGIMAFMMVIGLVKRYTLGYVFFRLTSDIEKLPFPLAPVSAQGAMALAEADAKEEEGEDGTVKKVKSPKWRLFSLGAYLGIGFGLLQVGIPAITGLFLSKPFYLIPQPFVDTTTLTESILPATPTGVTVTLGIVFIGFVLPFWSIMGTLAAILLTLILNPILHHAGVLHTWQPGMDTVNTTFANHIDFWMSFQIGAGFGIAAVSIYAAARDFRKKMKALKEKRGNEEKREDVWDVPVQGRGDYPIKFAILAYIVVAIAVVTLSLILIPVTPGIVFFLIFFSFIYNPFISYVSARLLGISGQRVDIPNIKEIAFIASGAQGIEIWLAPIPVENFGHQAQQFRVNELTGVSFWSLMKTDAVGLPVLFGLSLLFWGFIWHSDAVPSDVFPAAQVHWELAAKKTVLIYSSTYEDKSLSETEFGKALKPGVLGISFFGILIIFGLLSTFGLPIMFVYGLIRGFGNIPHVMVLEVVGAFLARFYFQKKYGFKKFRSMAPILVAGYFTGVGLISMATIALRLIKAAVSSAPF